MQRAYFVVEGQHDLAVVGQMLARRGARRVQREGELDAYWKRLVPRNFPHKGDLLKRVPVPAFFASEGLSVAVHVAAGHTPIVQVLGATLGNLNNAPDGVGVLLDADDEAVGTRWSSIANALSIDVGETPGEVVDGPPRAGVFVLPDNESQGSLAHLLLDCAEMAYPALLAGARGWIDPLIPTDKRLFANREDRRDFKKPFGREKAIVGSIAAVLRPEKAVQVSLQDNRWLSAPQAQALPRVRALQHFVDRVIGVPSGSS